MKNHHFFASLFCILFSFLYGCSGSVDTVTLNIPFTGALTDSTSAFVENGFSIDAIAQQNLSALQKNVELPVEGENWELFSEVDGASVGAVNRDVRFCSNPVDDGTKVSCIMPTTLILDDGSTVSSNAQFFCFPFDLEPDPACDSGEPGAQVVSLSCIGSGVVNEGTGSFADLIGMATVNYVGLEQRLLNSNGTHTFCRTVRSDWQVR